MSGNVVILVSPAYSLISRQDTQTGKEEATHVPNDSILETE